jgi:1-acyl-sn-glycerol-3-phosphate acyltransferase
MKSTVAVQPSVPTKKAAASERSLASEMWYALLKRLTWVGLAAAYWVRYTGQENIPGEGAILVVSNHQSFLDPPLVGAGCPRRMNYLARKTLFRFPLFGWLIRSLDAIPLDIEGIGFGGMKETLRRLRRGEMVLVFPEGSRTWDGEIGPLQPGFTALATRGRAAVLPVAIEGAFDAWPRWQKLPGLGVIHVHYGAPISAEEVKQLTDEELVAEVRDRVCQCLAVLRERRAFARGHAVASERV